MSNRPAALAPPPSLPGPDRLEACLSGLADAFETAGLWHALAYGSLLGAVRDQDVIPWDHDFDLFVRPGDLEELLELNPLLAARELCLATRRLPANRLALNPGKLADFDACSVSVLHQGEKVGDLYMFRPFSDGVLRLYDLASEAYWCPHSSFPAWFLEERSVVTLRGRTYFAPREPEAWLAGTYGDDWRTPYKAVMQGGRARPGVTTHGDRYEPKLHREIAECVARGWNRARYAREPAWPREVHGAGPRGPTARTQHNSQSLWWRDLTELVEHF